MESLLKKFQRAKRHLNSQTPAMEKESIFNPVHRLISEFCCSSALMFWDFYSA